MHHSCEMKNQFSINLHTCGRRESAGAGEELGRERSWGGRGAGAGVMC